MKLVEYQGKELFKRVGIPVPRGEHAKTANDVASFIAANPGSWVLKAQVQMGGRGKAGGIKFADNADEGKKLAAALIGTTLRGVQNPQGELVKSLLVEEKVAIEHEAYVSVTIDRSAKRPVFIVTRQGGMDIEEVAEKDPHALSKYWVDTAIGYSPFEARRLISHRSCRPDTQKNGPRSQARSTSCFSNTARISSRSIRWCSPKTDASSPRMRKSNSMTTRSTNTPSSPRGKENESPDNEDEAKAVAIGLGRSNYARLDGDIGVMANGAGLGMGTMDAIRTAGGSAANFLDVGGGAQAERVRKCYELDRQRSESQSDVHQHLRRDHARRCGRGGDRRGALGQLAAKSPARRAVDRDQRKEGREILAKAGIASGRDDGRRRRQGRRRREGSRLMSIWLDKNSRVIVQGITGREGGFHTSRMIAYGTNIVGGVTPGKGGTKIETGQPVFDTVKAAVEGTGATHSIIFVPPQFAADALYEAYDAGSDCASA